MLYEVIFDIETKSWFTETGTSDPKDLGASIVSLYARKLDDDHNEIEGQMLSFWESEFDQMWKYFLEADRIIGFNSIDFDVRVLEAYAPKDFAKLPHFDIILHVKNAFGHRVSLNAIARDTLGDTKIDSGANAVMYWQSGDPEKLALLKKYCEADVDITKRIYDYGLRTKKLKFTDKWNTPRVIDIDFSYPPQSSSVQTSLF